MKRFFFFFISLLCCSMMQAQSMKMVVNENGEVVGRYVRTNASTYTVDVQDSYDVPKAGNQVVTFSAAAGQGIVYRNQDKKGNINVRRDTYRNSTVIAQIPEFDGVPDTHPCLGVKNGYYKILIDGKEGYVRMDMAEWDGMSSF